MRLTSLTIFLLTALTLAGGARTANAEEPRTVDTQTADSLDGSESAAGDRAQSFQAVRGPTKEDVPGGPLLVAAYALVWIILLLYLLRMGRSARHVRDELRALREEVVRSAPMNQRSK